MVRMYEVVNSGGSLLAKVLQLDRTELRKLYAKREAKRVWTDGVLEIRLIVNQKACWCAVCPPRQYDGLGDARVGSSW